MEILRKNRRSISEPTSAKREDEARKKRGHKSKERERDGEKEAETQTGAHDVENRQG